MKDIKNILVPVDFSKNCRIALDWAMSISENLGAKVILFHVVEMPSDLKDRANRHLVLERNLKEKIKNEKTEELQTFSNEYDQSKIIISPEVSEGKPFIEIVTASRRHNVDLIVMGTHGRTGLQQMLIGSVAEKVVRNANCPVLTVKHPDFKYETL